MTDMIGLIAAMLTTVSFLPQTIMVLRTGQTAGISLFMYSLFTAGVAGWLAYGLLQNSLPIIVANAITLILAAVILAMKILHVSRSGAFVLSVRRQTR